MSPREEQPADYEIRQQIIYETVSKAFVWFVGVTQVLLVSGIAWLVTTTMSSERRIYILEDGRIQLEKRVDRIEGDVRDSVRRFGRGEQ